MSNNIDTNISSEQDADLLSDRPSRKPAAIPFGLNPDADLLTNKPMPPRLTNVPGGHHQARQGRARTYLVVH